MNSKSVLIIIVAALIICVIIYILFKRKSENNYKSEFDYDNTSAIEPEIIKDVSELQDRTEEFISSFGTDILNIDISKLKEMDSEDDEEYNRAYGIINYKQNSIEELKKYITTEYPIFKELKPSIEIGQDIFPKFDTNKQDIEYTEEKDKKYDWVSYISPIKYIFGFECDNITYDFNEFDRLSAIFMTIAENKLEKSNDRVFQDLALTMFSKYGVPTFTNVFKIKSDFEEEIVYVMSWASCENTIDINYNKIIDDPEGSMIFLNYIKNQNRFKEE